MTSTLSATDRSWNELLAGNERFAAGARPRTVSPADRRRMAEAPQRPIAAVLACSDSRVPVETVFDQEPGRLFVVRTAGHVLDPSVIGSLEFAITALDVPLIVVLGHESCGAVAATRAFLAGGTPPDGHVRDIVDRVVPSIAELAGEPGIEPRRLSAAHVRTTMDRLRSAPVLGPAVQTGRCGLLGAVYAMASGRVEAIDPA